MPSFDTPYMTRLAEDGKFVALTTAELTAMGMVQASATLGRFALLTYPVGTAAINITPASNTSVKSFITNAAQTLFTVSFPAPTRTVEVQNLSNGNIYISWANPTTFVGLSSTGIQIAAAGYYSLDYQATNLYVGSATISADIRIIAHY